FARSRPARRGVAPASATEVLTKDRREGPRGRMVKTACRRKGQLAWGDTVGIRPAAVRARCSTSVPIHGNRPLGLPVGIPPDPVPGAVANVLTEFFRPPGPGGAGGR